jgi:hypothetical protein
MAEDEAATVRTLTSRPNRTPTLASMRASLLRQVGLDEVAESL